MQATRTELLARRARIGLAEQGRNLWEDKRSALLRELNRLAAGALEQADGLEVRAARARAALAEAEALDGPLAVASASIAPREYDYWTWRPTLPRTRSPTAAMAC